MKAATKHRLVLASSVAALPLMAFTALVALVILSCGGDSQTPPTITEFTATPSIITSGTSATLSWTVSGADTLGLDQGIGTVTGTSRSVSPNATTTYTLTATNAVGSKTAQATVTVTAPPSLPVITSFAATPATINPGGSSTLAWAVTGADSLTINQGVGTVTGTSQSVSPSATTTYTLTATNTTGSSTATATVTVNTSPSLPVINSFTAAPMTINAGGNSTLSWSVTGANSLSINQGIGTVTGTSRVVNPSTTTTYTLLATNAAGTRTAPVTVTVTPQPGSGIIIDHTCTDLSRVPSSAIETAKAALKIAYGHTSHGSQLLTGMEAMRGASGSLLDYTSSWGYNADTFMNDSPFSGAEDLGNPTLSAWATATRNLLNRSGGCNRNVVMWSWCGQVSWASQNAITSYLSLMSQLEQDFPNVKFVYMTGHLDGSGVNGNLNQRNEQIRAYCRANNKILFDFADIESYDPDTQTNYMPLMCNDACDYDPDGHAEPVRDKNWAADWRTAHPSDPRTQLANSICSVCCQHSNTLNCVQKGRAAWWLWARLGGWNGQ